MPTTNDSTNAQANRLRQSEQYGELIQDYSPAVGSLSSGTWVLTPQRNFVNENITCEFRHRDSKARIRFENTGDFQDAATDISVYAELPDDSDVKQDPDDVDDMLVYATEFPMLEWAVWFAEFFARNIDRYNHQL